MQDSKMTLKRSISYFLQSVKGKPFPCYFIIRLSQYHLWKNHLIYIWKIHLNLFSNWYHSFLAMDKSDWFIRKNPFFFPFKTCIFCIVINISMFYTYYIVIILSFTVEHLSPKIFTPLFLNNKTLSNISTKFE